jgi:hypothetical protein
MNFMPRETFIPVAYSSILYQYSPMEQRHMVRVAIFRKIIGKLNCYFSSLMNVS